MSGFQIFTQPSQQALDIAANVLSGATLTFSLTGVSTPTDAYTNAALTIPAANPLSANSAGVWAPIFLDPAITYRVVLKTQAGAVLQTWDPANEDVLSALTSEDVATALDSLKRTPAEIAANVTPVNYAYAPGELLRQATNTTPGTTDMATGLQAAVDAADDIHAEVYIRDDVGLAKPILFRTTTQQNIAIVGNGRVSTIVRPLAADIKVAAQNVNCLFFNQNNNGHLHLEKFRCLDAAAYTGVFLYCTEGGGADASGQALFSAVVEDSWFAFSSNNTGIFRGGFSNLMVRGNVFEGTKTACFRLEGAGNSDHQYIGNVMNACYDSFLYAVDDTITKATITVDTLHAYQHLRGPLLEMKNVIGLILHNIIVAPDTANVGTTGIAKLTDCTDVVATNWLCKSRSGVPRAATCLEVVNGASGKFSNIITDATTGIAISGTGALSLTFEDCDFVGCDNAITFAGTLSGKIILRNCRLNDSQAYGIIVSSGTHSWDLTLIDCEIVNAGLRATATDRNLDLNTSGAVRLIRCKIGQDNGSAAAAYYIRAVGSGTFEVLDPIITGAPPTGLKTGAQTVAFSYPRGYGGTIASAATITLPVSGDVFDISGSTNITSITATDQEGRRITLAFQGALTFTDGSNLLLAGNLVTTSQDTITLVCIGANFYETGRSVN